MDFIPYGKQFIDDDDICSVVEVLKSSHLTTGPKIKEFENSLVKYCDVKYCVVVSSATAALHLSSLVLLKKGDKVLTTPNSFLATSNAILYADAKPVFIDICDDGNLDLDLCENEILKDNSIKAIYGVSFSGNMLNQKKLKYLKEKYNVLILEDNAHSIGATYNKIKAGSCKYSDISIFSFHPVKNLTTAEGGAITTNSKELYEKILKLRNHGIVKTSDMKPWEYNMEELGFNYRISDIQCALGISQLKKLPFFLKKRAEIAKKYDLAFKNSFIKPLYPFCKDSSYHLYVVQVDFQKMKISKDIFFRRLKEKNIGVQLHYMPINRQPFYKRLGYGKESIPKMDRYYEQSFSLPIYPSLNEDEQKYIIKTIFEIFYV